LALKALSRRVTEPRGNGLTRAASSGAVEVTGAPAVVVPVEAWAVPPAAARVTAAVDVPVTARK
jgi:hypothetical protein